MTKRKIKTFASMLLTALATLAATGCSSDTLTPRDLVIVAGINSNSKSIAPSDLSEKIYEVTYNSGTATVIVPDSTPDYDLSETISPPTDNPSPENRKRRAVTALNKLMEQITSLKPDSPECDLLSGLDKAARSAEGRNSAEVLVVSNRLSTAGYLDMRDISAIEKIDINDVLTELNELKAVPEWDGKEITWIILSVAGTQAELTPAADKKLNDLWTAIIEAGGGKVRFVNSSAVSAQTEGLPDVTSVAVAPIKSVIKTTPLEDYTPKITSELEDKTLDRIPDPDEIMKSDEAIKINDTTVRFDENSAELISPEEAIKALEPVAADIKAGNIRITLIGSCATYGEEQSNKSLSLKRAQKIKQLLCELGISEANITCIGAGYDRSNPYFTEDVGANGITDPDLAAKNRITVLTRSDNPLISNINGITE